MGLFLIGRPAISALYLCPTSLRCVVHNAPEEMLPGTTLDPRSYDPALRAKTPPLVARLGPGELDLLRQMADEFGTTRSALARRLVVKGLVELRDGVV
jgi:hypothetical protein